MKSLSERGWHLYPYDKAIADWADRVSDEADIMLSNATLQKAWLRHGGTWFAGVNCLDSEEDGSVSGVPLAGAVIDDLTRQSGEITWDKAQISVCYPGYPKKDPQESVAAHRFRRNRDAAHLDGLIPSGSTRRRFMLERHAFILGIPLDPVSTDTSPLVVWEGSHEIIRSMLVDTLEAFPGKTLGQIDLTDIYAKTRKDIFDRCRRVPITATPGAAYIVHRFCLHGVAPWTGPATRPRRIAYFRPETDLSVLEWLMAP